MATKPPTETDSKTLFYVQFAIGAAFMIFCGYGVLTTHETEWKTIYWAGLSGMVGIWIPSPSDKQ